MPDIRPPLPPFTFETAAQACLTEDTWNTCGPAYVALAYIPSTRQRDRSEFFASCVAYPGFSRPQVSINN